MRCEDTALQNRLGLRPGLHKLDPICRSLRQFGGIVHRVVAAKAAGSLSSAP
jgi:hypothetical protein